MVTVTVQQTYRVSKEEWQNILSVELRQQMLRNRVTITFEAPSSSEHNEVHERIIDWMLENHGEKLWHDIDTDDGLLIYLEDVTVAVALSVTFNGETVETTPPPPPPKIKARYRGPALRSIFDDEIRDYDAKF